MPRRKKAPEPDIISKRVPCKEEHLRIMMRTLADGTGYDVVCLDCATRWVDPL